MNKADNMNSLNEKSILYALIDTNLVSVNPIIEQKITFVKIYYEKSTEAKY